MNAFNLIINDLKQGVFKNIRFLAVPILCIFECLVADIQLNYIKNFSETELGFIDYVFEIFHGTDPLSKVSSSQLPYYWFVIFACLFIITFDYAQKDISHFGIQVMTRVKKRSMWWYSKVITNIVSSIYCYFLFMATILLFCVLNNYPVNFNSNSVFINVFGSTSGIYSYSGITDISWNNLVFLVLSPLMVMITLNLLLCMLSMAFKPIIALLVTIGYLLAGAFWDNSIIISRGSMIMMNRVFFIDGYNLKQCCIYCIIIIFLSIIIGRIVIEKYDILPERE